MIYGYSTGALAFDDFERGLSVVRDHGLRAVELSMLREPEVLPLIAALPQLNLEDFDYVSVHAPSRFDSQESEADVATRLQSEIPEQWPIVLHPDASRDLDLWKPFGERLLIENMDRRKTTGRTANDLATVFERLPEAQLCFDIAHARQVDPSMLEAWRILRGFGERLVEVHISELNTASQHRRISEAAVRAFRSVAHLIDDEAVVVLESVLGPGGDVAAEVKQARRALTATSVAVAS